MKTGEKELAGKNKQLPASKELRIDSPSSPSLREERDDPEHSGSG
jgi:hypothetical protein